MNEEIISSLKKLIEPMVQEAVKKELSERDKAVKKDEQFGLIPVRKIWSGENPLFKRTKFYAHVRNGDFTIYKIGNLTFVDKDEFESAFKKVSLKR